MPLQFRASIALPPHEAGGFDHADVHTLSGRVFVAHTALGQVEIIDGVQRLYIFLPRSGRAAVYEQV